MAKAKFFFGHIFPLHFRCTLRKLKVIQPVDKLPREKANGRMDGRWKDRQYQVVAVYGSYRGRGTTWETVSRWWKCNKDSECNRGRNLDERVTSLLSIDRATVWKIRNVSKILEALFWV
jgi:hypothetical protein